MRRSSGLIVVAALGLAMLAGCSSSPDISGTWQGGVEIEDERMYLALDLNQDDEDRLSGTMSLGDSGGEVAISQGRVSEDGTFEITQESQDAVDTSPVSIQGEVKGDRELEGDILNNGESYPFTLNKTQ